MLLVVGFGPGFVFLCAAASTKPGARNRSILCFGIVLGMDFMLFFFEGRRLIPRWRAW